MMLVAQFLHLPIEATWLHHKHGQLDIEILQTQFEKLSPELEGLRLDIENLDGAVT